jgi:hypothetical protein
MVVSVQHFADVVNGYEKTTSGLWTHRGKLVVLGTFVPPAAQDLEARVGELAVEVSALQARLERAGIP